MKDIISGFCAGILVLIGCCVYLSCESIYVGAVLFSVALLCICYKGFALFTGRVGYIPEKHDRSAIRSLLLCLLGNALAMIGLGLLIAGTLPGITSRAFLLCTAKLELSIPQAFVRAILCGILMYLAVSIYRDQKSIAAIFFCVPTFILSGFEHSIADMGYFAIAGLLTMETLFFLLLIILGNAVGGMLLPLLLRIGADE